MIGLGIGIGFSQIPGFTPSQFFLAEEPGVWYDPSDLTTLFQDSAGTTPVTAAGQPVGRINDKSGNGNHATQATAAARPTYGIVPKTGRRNLLTYSDQFDNAAWGKVTQGTGVLPVVTPNANVSPIGTMTASRVQLNAGTNTSNDYSLLRQAGFSGSDPFRRTIYIKSNDANNYQVSLVATRADNIVTAGQEWTRVETSIGGATQFDVSVGGAIGTSASADILVWGAQFELGSTATDYQKVTSAFDVTEAGVPSVHYLAFDGVDDFLVTPTITPGVDKAQVFTGVRKLSDAAVGMVVEHSASVASNNGVFYLTAPINNGVGNYGWTSKGTIGAAPTAATFNAPITNVVSGIGDIGNDVSRIRVNGAQEAESLVDQGTGNYLAHPMYIGRRGGTSLPFNGHLYSLITRFGPNLDATAINKAETYIAGKTGVTL